MQARATDLEAAMEATREISREIVLTRLLERIMRLSMENTGAQKGVLIMDHDGRLHIEATASGKDVTVGPPIPVAEDNEIPQTLVEHAARTGDAVVLGDAAGEDRFQSDPYIAARNVKSVLCLPSSPQEGRLCLLYLESCLAEDAFSPSQEHLLQLILTQAAISLANATLYEALEKQVHERTRELADKDEELKDTRQRLREARDRMIVQDRLASLGSLIAGIAHELKNPLNFVSNFSKLSVDLLKDLDDELDQYKEKFDKDSREFIDETIQDIRINLEKIDDHGGRADSIIRSTLEHSRGGEGMRREISLNDLVREYTDLAFHGLRAQDSSLRVEIDLDLDTNLAPIEVVPQEISRVVLNLAQNAFFAANSKTQDGNETVKPRVWVKTSDLGEEVEIRFGDNGNGIAKEIQDKVFEPFFTTKEPHQGTGLGLSLSHDIVVRNHGGSLSFVTKEGEFTEFVVALPKS